MTCIVFEPVAVNKKALVSNTVALPCILIHLSKQSVRFGKINFSVFL